MALLKNKKIKTEKRDLSPIAIIKILESTKPSWSELDDEFKEAYEKCIFLINRFISSKEIYLPLVDLLTTKSFTPERHYELLRNTISKQTHYFNLKAYKKNEDEEDKNTIITLLAIQKEYDLTEIEAKEHLFMIPKEEAKKISDKWKPILTLKKLI